MDETTMAFLVPREEASAALATINGHLAVAGLSITREDVLRLAEQRAELLAEVERVEFGAPVAANIAETIAGSPFLMQDNIADSLAGLQAVFYTLRDELPVDVPDDEIVDALRACFDEHEGELVRAASRARQA